MIYNLDYKFPKQVLLNEYNKLFDKKMEIKSPTEEFSGFWLLFSTDVTQRIAKDFIEYYNIPYDQYIVNFLYIEPNAVLPWHIDQERSMCAINCILTDKPTAIQFEDGEYVYDTALVDVKSKHKVVNNDNPRILYRITFQNEDATFEKVKNILCQKS